MNKQITMRSGTVPTFSRRDIVWTGIACGLVGRRAIAAVEPDPRPRPDSDKPGNLKADNPLPRFNGKDLGGWQVVDQFVFKRHGKVAMNDEVVSLGKGDPGTAIAWTGAAPPPNNYEISLEARRTDGDDFFCGLTFPVDKSHCTLIVGGWGGSVTGLSNIDDFPAVENETTGAVEIVQNRWHSIRLRVTPHEIQAWFDQSKIVDLDPKGKRFSIWWEQEPVRPLGIASWNTAASVRRFSFKRVP